MYYIPKTIEDANFRCLRYNEKMDQFTLLQKIILYVIPILFAITIHETAHGWVASMLGDQTAKVLGRLTLNPIKHIDIIGTVLLPAVLLFLGGFIFGWAKPVPITWQNLKHPRRDVALVALAGPASNLVMAVLWAGLAKLGSILIIHSYWLPFAEPLYYMAIIGIFFNIVLMVLNLIPLPPLDGSRVIACMLKGKVASYYMRIEPYGFLILLALLALGVLNKIIMPLALHFQALISAIFGLPL